MIIIFWITLFYILLYFAYPVVLFIVSLFNREKEKETEEIISVSLILISYNGKKYLKNKIKFLLKELSGFQHSELIIIDDNSSDNSNEVLDLFKDVNGVCIIYKKRQKGIPHSMNLGVNRARYDTIVFCDQRQNLSDNILRNIVEPLNYENVGAVSGYISHFDKEKGISLLRLHENFIKSIESKVGCLIGVYGPFYAIKKDCYSAIPENIILDDLYLSLNILKTKQIKLRKDCQIVDDNFSLLYDYNRTKRYLMGFRQILNDKGLMRDLSVKQKGMLIWHKYMRLIIPFFLFLSYVSVGMLITQGVEFAIIFIVVSVLILVSLFPNLFKARFRLQDFIRMNIFYFFAFIDLFISKIFLHKKPAANSDINVFDSQKVKANN